jgi:hypothetical protein
MSVDCIVADDNPLLDFLSIKNLNLNLTPPLIIEIPVPIQENARLCICVLGSGY